MKFSVCIPNYNYDRYLGKTIQSVLDQSCQDFEIMISDNASSDRSLEVVRSFDDERIHLRVNARNVGFAGNLDRVAGMATGKYMVMLSSDDLMYSNALTTYYRFFDVLGFYQEESVISSTWDIIDSDDRVTGETGPDPELWRPADRVPELEAIFQAMVYGVDAAELLRRCLLTMKNPFNFAATCYPRALYEKVEGYGGGRLINPDKWFHWKLLSVARRAYFIDQKEFAYRWHADNQAALQTKISALKYPVDEYVATLEVDALALHRAGLSREQVIDAFVERDIARHGLASLGCGDRLRAKRILDFGRGCYPRAVQKNRKAQALKWLLALGPLGQAIAKQAYRKYRTSHEYFP